MRAHVIQTRFDNYAFRSRLEARWACFFKALGLAYDYELEGFDLDGLWYLPDFWLPELDCWIELKGQPPLRPEEEKASLLAQGTRKRVYLFWGDVCQEACEQGREDGG